MTGWQKRLVGAGSVAGAVLALMALWAATGWDSPPWAAAARLQVVEATQGAQGRLLLGFIRDKARREVDEAKGELAANPASGAARRELERAEDELARANAQIRAYDRVTADD